METKIEDSDYKTLYAAIQECKLGHGRLARILQSIQREIADDRAEVGDKFQLLEQVIADTDALAQANVARRHFSHSHPFPPPMNMGQGVSHHDCVLRIAKLEADCALFDHKLSTCMDSQTDSRVEGYRTRIVNPEATMSRVQSPRSIPGSTSDLARRTLNVRKPMAVRSDTSSKSRCRGRGDDLTINMNRDSRVRNGSESCRLVRRRGGWCRAGDEGNGDAMTTCDTRRACGVPEERGRRARSQRKAVSFASRPNVKHYHPSPERR